LFASVLIGQNLLGVNYRSKGLGFLEVVKDEADTGGLGSGLLFHGDDGVLGAGGLDAGEGGNHAAGHWAATLSSGLNDGGGLGRLQNGVLLEVVSGHLAELVEGICSDSTVVVGIPDNLVGRLESLTSCGLESGLSS